MSGVFFRRIFIFYVVSWNRFGDIVFQKNPQTINLRIKMLIVIFFKRLQ